MRKNQSSPARKSLGTFFNIMCCVDTSSVPPLCCVSCFFFLTTTYYISVLICTFIPLLFSHVIDGSSFWIFPKRWQLVSLRSVWTSCWVYWPTAKSGTFVLSFVFLFYECECKSDVRHEAKAVIIPCSISVVIDTHFFSLCCNCLLTDWAKAGWMKSCSTNGSQVCINSHFVCLLKIRYTE